MSSECLWEYVIISLIVHLQRPCKPFILEGNRGFSTDVMTFTVTFLQQISRKYQESHCESALLRRDPKVIFTESPWIFVTGTWGLMAFVRKTEKMAPRQLCFPGSALKDYLLKNDSSPCPLHSHMSLLQRLRRPYVTTATQKKTKLKKNNITRQPLYKTTSC